MGHRFYQLIESQTPSRDAHTWTAGDTLPVAPRWVHGHTLYTFYYTQTQIHIHTPWDCLPVDTPYGSKRKLWQTCTENLPEHAGQGETTILNFNAVLGKTKKSITRSKEDIQAYEFYHNGEQEARSRYIQRMSEKASESLGRLMKDVSLEGS